MCPTHLKYVQQLMQPLPHDAHILAPSRLKPKLLELTRNQLPWHLHAVTARSMLSRDMHGRLVISAESLQFGALSPTSSS